MRAGARDDMANYRPIALTSIVAKLYESIICSRLTDYIERNKLIGALLNGSNRPARSDYYYYAGPPSITAQPANRST